MKDVRDRRDDDDRENGTNGDDRKGDEVLGRSEALKLTFAFLYRPHRFSHPCS